MQFELWDSDDVPVPRSELLQKVKGIDALLCVLTEKIDTELLDAAGQVIVFVVHVNVLTLTQCKGPPLMCLCWRVCVPTGPNLKVISTMSVGFDHLNLEELKKRSVT